MELLFYPSYFISLHLLVYINRSRTADYEMAVLLGCQTKYEMLDYKDVARRLCCSHYELASHFSQSDQQPYMDDSGIFELFTLFTNDCFPGYISFSLIKMHIFLLSSYLVMCFNSTLSHKIIEGMILLSVKTHLLLFISFSFLLEWDFSRIHDQKEDGYLWFFFVLFYFLVSLTPKRYL